MKKKRLEAWRQVLAGTIRGFGQHRCMTESGALAFYTLFSLAPILIVTIAVGSAFFDEDSVRGLVVRQFAARIGARVVWSRGSETALAQSLKKREIDMAVGGFDAKTPWASIASIDQPPYSQGTRPAIDGKTEAACGSPGYP